MVNNITIWDIVAFGRDEIGGDFSEDLFHNGFTKRRIMGHDLIITIKTNLVPTDFMYMFAAPKFLGDFYILDDVTISNKSENFLIDMFAYECIGSTIKNEGAVAIASFGVDSISSGTDAVLSPSTPWT